MAPPKTKFNAARAVRWFKKHMGMEDWQFKVNISPDPPEWAPSRVRNGCCEDKIAYKHAWIWLSLDPGRHKTNCLGSIQATLFHEMLHVAIRDSGTEDLNQATSDHTEFLLNRLACILAAAYLADVEVYR